MTADLGRLAISHAHTLRPLAARRGQFHDCPCLAIVDARVGVYHFIQTCPRPLLAARCLGPRSTARLPVADPFPPSLAGPWQTKLSPRARSGDNGGEQVAAASHMTLGINRARRSAPVCSACTCNTWVSMLQHAILSKAMHAHAYNAPQKACPSQPVPLYPRR